MPVAVQDKPKATVYESACGKTEDHDEADLCEQRRMAEAARDTLKYVELQTYIGGLGLLFVFAGLVFSGVAALAARDAAKAADRAADVASDTAKKQLRAYVHVAKSYVLHVSKPGKRVVSVVIKNFGSTPASNVKFRLAVHVREYPLKTVLPPIPPDMPTSTEPLPPQRDGTLNVPVSMLSVWEEQQLQKGLAGIYAWGDITYTDIFGQNQTTNFRLVCEGEGLAEGRMHTCIDGNEAT